MNTSAKSMLSRLPDFCPDCASVLPSLQSEGDVVCYSCQQTFGPEGVDTHYVIHFNSYNKSSKKQNTKNKISEQTTEGPIVERKCPKCGNEKMSYATLQLRSADEGQTVFYTCTNCKHKETENS